MKLTSILYILVLIMGISVTDMSAQNVFVNKERVIEELEKRGLDYDVVSDALAERGVDLRFLDRTAVTPEKIKIIQEVILELEAEKELDGNLLEDEDLDEEIEIDSTEIDFLLDEDEEEPIEEDEEDVEKEEIVIFGQQLFSEDILELQSKSEEINAPDSYILGPGDDIIVSIWGRSQFDNAYKLEEDGYIKILDGKRRVFLKGLSLGEARNKLFKIFKEYYSFNFGEFSLSLNFSRTVKVSIWGEVKDNPGSFAVPAFNSAFNTLSLVGGTNEIGSLRNIQLKKSNGKSLRMDIYEFMQNPAIASDYYLEENDIILIPVAEKIVTLEGAVRRPLKYELISKEGMKELLKYAGGLAEDAFQKKIQVHRFEDDGKKIIDLNWREYARTGRNFELNHGDRVVVETIETEINNFVEVIGAVAKPGRFQREQGMRISDLVLKAGLTDQSNTSIVFLTRDNKDGSFEYKKLNLKEILENPSIVYNLQLEDRDKIEIWQKNRFSDEIEIAVDGAVRFPGKFPYDASQTLKVTDAIILSGGLRRDASSYAIIHQNDTLNSKVTYYRTINNLEELFENPDNESNYVLEPFDSLVVKSKSTFLEESYVRIEGAVNSPGEYQYGLDMTIKDLLTLAGGFKLAASTNNIEISRVIIQNNKSTKTVVANLEVDRSFNVIKGNNIENDYRLEPYDNIAVRYIKEFQLQQRVFLDGEVVYPGPYAIAKENEKILSILERAGGLTDEAFPAGATLERDDQELGFVVLKLDEIIENPNSEFNFFVRNGDVITVPKVREFVTIRGATRANEVGVNVNEGNEIHVPFHSNKDAMFYVNEYAGGLHELADKSEIIVKHANGEIKRIEPGLFKRKGPKVYRGSIITVGFKSLERKEEDKKTDVDWTKVLGDSVSQAMSILTLILLIGRID